MKENDHSFDSFAIVIEVLQSFEYYSRNSRTVRTVLKEVVVMAECYSQENPFHILQKEQLLGLRPIPGWYFVWIGLATGIARIVEEATGIVRIVEVATEIVGGVNYFEQFLLCSFKAR